MMASGMSRTNAAELARQREVSAEQLQRRADWIRLQTLALIDGAGLGHYSSTLSCA